jgi:peptidoglycan hydrolase-like protein with peptidoglycan-binding domain
MEAFLTRLNAVWFDGSMNDIQRQCLTVFASAYLLYTRVLGRDVPVSWLAYGLATAYHETAFTMKPIAEYGKGAGYPYGEPDPTTGQVYYGRGLVQLTWLANYQKAQLAVINPATMQLDVPLVNNPDLALNPFYAAQILISGMSEGWFTGRKFSDYLTDTKTDYVGARYIINGQDKAQPIAAYATEGEDAVQLALGMGITRSTIQNGSKGTDACELQLMLGCDPDGIAGNNTISALMDFQRNNNLDPDGICGTQSWAALDKEINHV